LAYRRRSSQGAKLASRPSFSFSILRRTKWVSSSKILTHFRTPEKVFVRCQWFRLPSRESTRPTFPVPGGLQNAPVHRLDEPQLNSMREETDGFAQTSCATCPLVDGTHECIPSLVPGQLFFGVFSTRGRFPGSGMVLRAKSYTFNHIAQYVPEQVDPRTQVSVSQILFPTACTRTRVINR
jgi:hypothetical protein